MDLVKGVTTGLKGGRSAVLNTVNFGKLYVALFVFFLKSGVRVFIEVY